MKQLSYIAIATSLLLVCAAGAFAQTPWFDDFNLYVHGDYPPAPWESTIAIADMNGVGYGGTMGVQGTGNGDASLGGRMYRAGGGTNAYVVWKEYLGESGNPGEVMGALATTKTTDTYGLGSKGLTYLYTYQSPSAASDYTMFMRSYRADGTAIGPRQYGPSLARAWYEFKLEAVGLQVSSYYRPDSGGIWNLIGTDTQEVGFAPNYVGIALGSRGFVDDVGFNTDGVVPEPGSLLAFGSALIGFAGLAIRRRK